MIMDIIICIIYIFIGVRWIFKNIRLGTFSACTTWKIMGLKLFMLLMVPLALFVYVYLNCAENLCLDSKNGFRGCVLSFRWLHRILKYKNVKIK